MRLNQLIILAFIVSAVTNRLKAQPYGCQVFKSAQAPLYYNAEDLRSDTFDVLKYTINLEIGNSSTKSIKGNTQVRFAPKLNGRNYIRFDLLKLLIDSVKENNSLRTYVYNDTILRVNFTAPKNTNDTSVFTIYYHGQPVTDATGWGGFYFDNTQGAEYAYNLGVGFGAKPHNYGRVWFPCFDNFVERSKYEFNITSDTARRAYCNGQLMSDVVNGLNRTRQWVLNEEIPSYLASVSLAKYSRVNWTVNTLNGTKPIWLVAYANDTTALKNGFVNLKNCIGGFENYFGPYKWNRFGYCVVPFNSGAMEHATNITYPKPFIGNIGYEADLMAHELSHHWWGDLITCETPEDMWINEGMATYSSYLFLEWQYGKSTYMNKVKTQHDNLLHFLFKKEGFRAISGVPHALTYGDHVYLKGADVAHSLRGYMGDSAFFAAAKYTMQQNAFKSISSLQLKNLFQTGGGQNLNDFFNGWVFGSGWPHFAVDSVKYVTLGTNSVSAFVSIKQKLYGAPALYNNVPLEISFFKNDWSRVVRKVLLSGASGSFTLSLPFMPVMYALNYDGKINDATSQEAKTVKANGNLNFALGKVFLTVQNKGADSSLIRVTHNYVRPDDFKTNTKGHRLSNQHFWKVEGILSPGFLSAIKFNYDGTKSTTGTYSYLDTMLTIVNGDSIGLFYRPDASAEWMWQKNATKYAYTSKTGFLQLDSLLLGEYCFGNVSDTSSVGILHQNVTLTGVSVFPNPAKNSVNIVCAAAKDTNLELQLLDESGRRVLQKTLHGKSNKLNLNDLPKGLYVLSLSDSAGRHYTQQLIVE